MSPDPWSDDAVAHVCEEREGRIYHIEFLGREHTHNWLVEDKVRLSTQHTHISWPCSIIEGKSRLLQVLSLSFSV